MEPLARPPWLDEVRVPPPRIPASATRPAPLLFDAEHRPIRTPESWGARRRDLSGRWREFLGRIPAPRAVPTLATLEEDRVDGVVRRLVRYESEAGLAVEGYLLRPEAPGRDRPGVVVLHSTVPYTIRQP